MGRFKHEIGDIVTIKYDGEYVEASYAGMSDKYEGLAMVNYNGRLLPRKIYDRPGGRPNRPVVPMKESRYDVDRRFEFITRIVNMVITGESKSVIISGSGGLGKTYSVMECLNAAELTNVDDFEENIGADELDLGEEKMGDYVVVKGFSTPKALYRLLWNNKDRIIVFDDCDSVWDNPTSLIFIQVDMPQY